MISKNSKKHITKFYCEKCDYYAKRKGDLTKHFNSKKHNQHEMITDDYKNSKHLCKCGKSYTNKQNLTRHQKNCDYKNSKPKMSDFESAEIISTKDSELHTLKNMFMRNPLQPVIQRKSIRKKRVK